jgi:MFS family permease
MAFQPADSLKSRTFWGLIIAQFLAGFNDQAIHASAMFFALHRGALTEAEAISLMPILFFAPWAIFCTISGHLADRYSKTTAIVIWKWSEVLISLILLGGFYLGTVVGHISGAWIVLSCVFLMGTHAAFFAPAKYGAMPEILQPHILSRGNGVLESTTFLAAILGTVTGGALSFWFRDREIWIGVVLLILSLGGAFASLMIARLPPANPGRIFPANPFKPLYDNLKVLLTSKPLALSVLGIAFFVFMVAYMRQTMYMHGETRNPRWDEFRTSLVVAAVALGVGLGAPGAGYLSGGKIELGLVPLGCVGMIFATILAGFQINNTTMLVVALVIIGIFSGFYMVPLYTLLQHRAPKASKGDLVATSNFINVVGAMAASLLFFLLVQGSRLVGVSPEIPQTDNFAIGKLAEAPKFVHGHMTEIVIDTAEGRKTFTAHSELPKLPFDNVVDFLLELEEELRDPDIVEFEDNLFEVFGATLKKDDQVIVSTYTVGNSTHYRVRPAGQPLTPVYNNEGLPRFLFLGAAFMTLCILILLVRKLPDFFVRSLFWMRSLGRFRLKAVGMQHLPTHGPVILAANCDRLESSLQLISATDRSTLFVLWENPERREKAPLLRALAQRSALVEVSKADHAAWMAAHGRAKKALHHGELLAVTVDGHADDEVESLIADLRQGNSAPIVPVYCGALDNGAKPRVRVVFGAAVRDGASLADIRQEIRQLGEWVRANDGSAEAAH